jgi:hypothetical protein
MNQQRVHWINERIIDECTEDPKTLTWDEVSKRSEITIQKDDRPYCNVI